MPLVAEGLRKLAMIARLVTTGTLLQHGYLFWDEPETNLNPRIIRVVARTIATLAKSGIQLFITTHSLYLLRELELLTTQDDALATLTRYFALARAGSDTDEPVLLQQGASLTDLDTIITLDEELEQSDRFVLVP